MTIDAETRGIDLLNRGRHGEIVAVSQLITALESNSALGRAVRPRLHAATGQAHVIGVTGAPGSGKSTLVGAIAGELRTRKRSVGIIAVDPSSAVSGGAILGDRIRMSEGTRDSGVFMRSMSSRGKLGGVSRATVDAVAVLDATGRNVIIIETVGAGQADVEIVEIAQTTIVVSVPGLGDEIQAIKAGLLEVADIHLVNKADRPEANKTVADLRAMLRLRGPLRPGEWALPVLSSTALSGDGIPQLVDTIEAHLTWLRASGEFARRERAATSARIRTIAKELLLERMRDMGAGNGFSTAVDEVIARRLDPHSAAIRLLDHMNVNQ